MADVFPGQKFYGVVRDRRGNGLASVVIDVLASGTAEVLATVQSDEDGRYTIPLIDGLSFYRLVDVRFSGEAIVPAYVQAGVVLTGVAG